MPDPIQHPGLPKVGPVGAAGPAAPTHAAGDAAKQDFKSVLLESLDEVNRLQKEASEGVQRLMTGEHVNVAEVFATVRKADVAFSLLMEIRNKLQDAYREIQQMRV